MNCKLKITVCIICVFFTSLCWGTPKTIHLSDCNNNPVTNINFLLNYFINLNHLKKDNVICLDQSECFVVLELVDTSDDLIKEGYISTSVMGHSLKTNKTETISFKFIKNENSSHLRLFENKENKEKKEEQFNFFPICSFNPKNNEENIIPLVPNYDIIIKLLKKGKLPKGIILNLFGNIFHYLGPLGNGGVSTVLKVRSNGKIMALKLPNAMSDISSNKIIQNQIYPDLLNLNQELKDGMSLLGRRSIKHVGLIKNKMELPYYIVSEYVVNPITLSKFFLEIIPQNVKCSLGANGTTFQCSIKKNLHNMLKLLLPFLTTLTQIPSGGDLKPDNIVFGRIYEKEDEEWMVLDCGNTFSTIVNQKENANNFIENYINKDIRDTNLDGFPFLHEIIVDTLFSSPDYNTFIYNLANLNNLHMKINIED